MRNEIQNKQSLRADALRKYKIRKKQSGQVIIILLMLMLVGLSIVLAMTQRSVTDVTTSTQAEQSTRAFSAAEAGIEKALTGSAPAGTQFDLGNNSSALINQSGLLPYNNSFAGIEYPPVGRETTAHFWFVDPSNLTTPPVTGYNASPSRVDLYYGNENTTDLPAVEVRIVMFANNNFYTYTKYYDSSAARTDPGPSDNNFDPTSGCGSQTLTNSILGTNRKFYCRQTVPSTTTEIPKLGGGSGSCTFANGCTLILARVRLIYVNENHSLALAPPNPNPTSAQFPPQVQIYNAVGTSGKSQKQIQAFRVRDVIPPWFDFAIFSVNEIRK